MVDTPKNKKLKLTPAQERVAENRMLDNAVTQHKQFKFDQIYEALSEIRFYLLFIAAFAISMQNGGMLVYSTTFTMALGFSVSDKLPFCFFLFFFFFFFAWVKSQNNPRFYPFANINSILLAS